MTVPALSGIWTVFGCNLSNKGNNNKKSLLFFFFNYKLQTLVCTVRNLELEASFCHLVPFNFESYLMSNRENRHAK